MAGDIRLEFVRTRAYLLLLSGDRHVEPLGRDTADLHSSSEIALRHSRTEASAFGPIGDRLVLVQAMEGCMSE